MRAQVHLKKVGIIKGNRILAVECCICIAIYSLKRPYESCNKKKIIEL